MFANTTIGPHNEPDELVHKLIRQILKINFNNPAIYFMSPKLFLSFLLSFISYNELLLVQNLPYVLRVPPSKTPVVFPE